MIYFKEILTIQDVSRVQCLLLFLQNKAVECCPITHFVISIQLGSGMENQRAIFNPLSNCLWKYKYIPWQQHFLTGPNTGSWDLLRRTRTLYIPYHGWWWTEPGHQEMASCLMATNHCLNLSSLIISEFLRHSSEGNFNENAHNIDHLTEFENYACQIIAVSPRGQEAKSTVVENQKAHSTMHHCPHLLSNTMTLGRSSSQWAPNLARAVTAAAINNDFMKTGWKHTPNGP